MQFAIDGQVEQRQITCLLRELESAPYGPDISDSERGFLPDKLFLVPRLMAAFSYGVHGSPSTLRDDKGGSVTMAGSRYLTQSLPFTNPPSSDVRSRQRVSMLGP